jgi:N-acetylglucosamine-6-phosphate deacetylase
MRLRSERIVTPGGTISGEVRISGASLRAMGLSCELMCDGVHVDPVAARLLHRGSRTARGAIAAGFDADLAVLEDTDDGVRACGTMVGGAWVYGPLAPA